MNKDDKYKLPLTKYNEEYYLIKEENNNSIHYHIVNSESNVIGRFDVGNFNDMSSITYRIIPEYQNRGIGQITLKYVVGDLFNSYDINRIVLLPTNERSSSIALKAGFDVIRRGVYGLKRIDYEKNKQKELTHK